MIKSQHGIALRRRELKAGKGIYELAVVSDKGVTHIIQTKTGAIRRMTAVDQLREDWEPFQEIRSRKSRKVVRAEAWVAEAGKR